MRVNGTLTQVNRCTMQRGGWGSRLQPMCTTATGPRGHNLANEIKQLSRRVSELDLDGSGKKSLLRHLPSPVTPTHACEQSSAYISATSYSKTTCHDISNDPVIWVGFSIASHDYTPWLVYSQCPWSARQKLMIMIESLTCRIAAHYIIIIIIRQWWVALVGFGNQASAC